MLWYRPYMLIAPGIWGTGDASYETCRVFEEYNMRRQGKLPPLHSESVPRSRSEPVHTVTPKKSPREEDNVTFDS